LTEFACISFSNEIIDQFLMSSKCATDKEKQFLYYLLGNKKLATVLLLRASENGRVSLEFRARNPEGPFICLLKVKDGDCIGSYSKTELDIQYLPIEKGDSMLFNLTCCRYFPLKEKDTGYPYNDELYYGAGELTVKHPYNGNNNCYSDTNYHYGIPFEDGKNMLTNKEGKYFTITEMEIWKVTEMEQ
jgi:hypothetical protein